MIEKQEAKALRPPLYLNDNGSLFLPTGMQRVEKSKAHAPRRPWMFSALLLTLDCLGWCGIYIGLSTAWGDYNRYGSIELILPLGVAIAVLGLVGGYNPRCKMASLKYATEHIIAGGFGFLVSAVGVYVFATFGSGIASSRAVLIASFAAFTLFSLYHRRTLWFAHARFRPKRSILVIGDDRLEERFYNSFVESGHDLDLCLLAVDEGLVGTSVAGPDSPIFEASTADLAARLSTGADNQYEAILVAAEGELSPDVLAILAKVHFQDMPVYSLTSFYEAYWEKMPVHLLSATWPLQAGFHLVKHSVFATMKRASDIGFSLLLIVLASPLMLFAAVAIKLTSSGPVIFRQTRVGQHRDLFTLYKFRSMLVGSEAKGMYTELDDPRVTAIGRFLRKSRLDELPQLVNVLRGDMSLIGPRAEWIKCVERYEEIIPHYHFRHLVRPGITGWAQVNYPYGASDKDMVEKLKYDLFYIRNFSLNLDASVILKTLHVILFGKGR